MNQVILMQKVGFKDGSKAMLSDNISTKLDPQEAFRLDVRAGMARVRSGGAQ